MKGKSLYNVIEVAVTGVFVVMLTAVLMLVVTTLDNNEKVEYNNQEITTVRISVDEWPGWGPLFIANGGSLITTADSINARNGIKVQYVIMNDATISSNALISNELQGAGYTVNRYAFLQNKFDTAGVEVIMPYITNYSNGADGIIAKASIQSVEDLVGKKIAVPRYSEAQTLIEWLIRNSSLSASEVNNIRSNMVYFETADDTAEAFFAGNVDAAATWEPYLTQAASSTNSRILFDTSMATNLILDGILFRKDFVENNEDFVLKLIDGALEANRLYLHDFDSLRVMPMFELSTDDEIKEICELATVANCADNLNLLEAVAPTMYREMANIWNSIGEIAIPDKADIAFTNKYVQQLRSKYSGDRVTSFAFSSEGRQAAQQIANNSALLSARLDIKFEVDSYKISQESFEQLSEFAEKAKILNGVYIQIEGNTAKVDGDDGKDFSYKRARSVAKFLQGLGIDPARFVIIGNGDTKPIDTNLTEEGKANNRRTEVFFKVVGY